MAEQIQGNIWIELDRMSREHLSKSALLAQQADIQEQQMLMQAELNAAETALNREHDKRLRELEISKVIYDQKWQQKATKQLALDTKVNESEANKLAFSLLKDKDTTGGDKSAFDIVDAYKTGAIDNIGAEINNLNNDIVAIDQKMIDLNNAITNVSLGSEALKSLALMTTPTQGVYDPADIDNLILQLPEFEGKKISGQQLDGAIASFSDQSLNPNQIPTFDLTKDGVVNQDDKLYYNALTELSESFPEGTKLGNDTLEKLSDLTFTTKGIDELNKQLRTQQILDPTHKFTTANFTEITNDRDKYFVSVKNALLEQDPETEAWSLKENTVLDYANFLKDQGIGENNLAAHNQNMEAFRETMSYISSSTTAEQLLSRVDEIAQTHPTIMEYILLKDPNFNDNLTFMKQKMIEAENLQSGGSGNKYIQSNVNDAYTEGMNILEDW